MLDEQLCWPAASGPFRAGGEGWHWQAARMETHYRARLNTRQRRLIDESFFGIYSLCYSMAHLFEANGEIHWRFDGGRKVKSQNAPFTIYHVQSLDGYVVSNVIYDMNGRASVQVDFARHGTERAGHWHPLVIGTFYHLEHYSWDACPILWQLVPRTIGPLFADIGR